MMTVKTKGCLSRKTALAMAFKLLERQAEMAEAGWIKPTCRTHRRSAVQAQANQTRRLIAPSPTFGYSSSLLVQINRACRLFPLVSTGRNVIGATNRHVTFWMGVSLARQRRLGTASRIHDLSTSRIDHPRADAAVFARRRAPRHTQPNGLHDTATCSMTRFGRQPASSSV